MLRFSDVPDVMSWFEDHEPNDITLICTGVALQVSEVSANNIVKVKQPSAVATKVMAGQ